MDATNLVDEYFALWRTTDDERHALVRKVFSPTAVHCVAPADVRCAGIDEIEANIARVNKEHVQEAGDEFLSGAGVANHDSVQLEWVVANPAGAAVGGGRDFLLLDDDGRVKALYMFMN